MKPQVVIVGRPNVGKSSLVNRLAGRRVAVVEEHRGVTRDRKTFEVEWTGSKFDVVDTGGWLQSGDALEEKVSQQAVAALDQAALILLVVDAAVGMTDEDQSAARWVLRTGRPAMLIANKVDDNSQEALIWEFIGLGMGEPFPVSALHGRGSGDLLDRLVEHLNQYESEAKLIDIEDEPIDEESLRVAIVGRPNVGKSTLFNRLIGEERSVVHDMPGTTRDAVDTVVDTPHGRIRYIDTAGMRKKARTEAGLETYAVLRSLEALDRADIAVLVIDATQGATGQDQRLAERISAAGCPAVVVLNKWELLDAEQRLECVATVADKRIHGTTRQQVSACFEKERPHLLPLAEGLFPCFTEAQRSVGRDGFVEVAKAYYEAPPELIGRKVWVRWDARCVRLFNERMEQVALHTRLEPGRFSRSLGAGGWSTPVRGTCKHWVSQASVLGEHCGQWAQAAADARGPEAIRAIM
ncbi:MAG: ribosome biogenesis GTPase Der, partial [Actinobacteria bacterium]|nr:ribosome biogenesis GTPase Der [Actinomycetota bacterium]